MQEGCGPACSTVVSRTTQIKRIELRRVTKRFGSVTAVDDFSLTVEPGSFLTILGPSGCGKTTILRMIAGLEEPDSGEILIDGRPVFSYQQGIFVPPARRGVGMVFQTYALWPHMTVFENVAFGLELARWGREDIRARTHKVLADLQLAGLEDRYPQEMSGGQQQRVALARMLAPGPGIFLLDEPLSNLDARLRMEMRSELKRLHRESLATVVYVTHDQLEALTMSTHVAVVRQGRLEQLAPPDELYRRPATLFVADFVGTPRMNLLRATVRQEAGHHLLDFQGFSLPYPNAVPCRDVVVGIRPEHIGLSLQPASGAIAFKVYSVLPSGSELIVNVRREGTALTIREVRPLHLEIDSPVWLSFDPTTLTLYDPDTSRLLDHAAGG
ncbi:MAG: ABC transporter ATP-binding protein [Armatimonadota bacterium]|nr:ABC transporter ATP-binding protein [Armatimonadota bacterium]